MNEELFLKDGETWEPTPEDRVSEDLLCDVEGCKNYGDFWPADTTGPNIFCARHYPKRFDPTLKLKSRIKNAKFERTGR